jgi:hypothetical protein
LCSATTAHAQSEAETRLMSPERSGADECGAVHVAWGTAPLPTFQTEGRAQLEATSSDGQPVFELSWRLGPGEQLIPLWCADLLGDGRWAFAFERFSGGAHCCFSATILLLEPGAPRLLDLDLGNSGLVVPRQLDGGGPLEVPTQSDVFAYFDGLAYAASPVLPMVLAFDGTHYVESTRQFPDLLHDEVRQAQTDLAEVVARQTVVGGSRLDYEEQQGVALRLYGLHVLAGDADQALPAIQSMVAPPVAQWLQESAPTAAEAMARVYHLDR